MCSHANVNTESNFFKSLRREISDIVSIKNLEINLMVVFFARKQIVIWSEILFLYFACILLSVSIKYLVSRYSSLHSYNKQCTSWLVRLYHFYYSRVVKNC